MCLKSHMPKPYVYINCAMSIDGKLSLKNGMPISISDEEDLKRVHQLRSSVDAILIGANTVINDDPSLRVKEKYVENPKQPIRIILDGKGRINDNARVLDGSLETWILTSKNNPKEYLKAKKVIFEKENISVYEILKYLESNGISKLLVEGGGTIISEFITENAFDLLTIYVGNIIIGENAPSIVRAFTASSEKETIKLQLLKTETKKNGILLYYSPI